VTVAVTVRDVTRDRRLLRFFTLPLPLLALSRSRVSVARVLVFIPIMQTVHRDTIVTVTRDKPVTL
tara:strand:- start:374 stop:571 length:198 start_codon:yes stop_codon:yes gene_type:complete